ncbi:MAG: NAD-dependent epimerase/dehydratase family protein [Geminicoccaceae bacterium]
MKPTTLVTGANGFTGSFMCQYYAQLGIPTRGMYYEPDGRPDFSHPNLELVPGDLRDRASLKRAVDGIEIVQNVAALYRPTNVPEQDYYDVNIDGIRNIVEEAHAAGVKRFVQMSTIGIYGHVANPPADENAPIKPDDYYQLTKLKGEEVAVARGKELGLPVVVIRPAAIYGKRETRFLKIAQLIKRGRLIQFGDGKAYYHFIHVQDLSDACLLAAEKDGIIGEAFIIADDHALTVDQIIKLFAKSMNVPAPSIRLPMWLLDSVAGVVEGVCKPFKISPPIHRRRAAWFRSTRSFKIDKARRVLGYEPKILPEDGLPDMIRSYEEAGWLK